MKNNSIQKRIQTTLQIVEQRGYNLTLERLSKILIGGEIPLTHLRQYMDSNPEFDTDGIFVATRGNLFLQKCKTRKQHHSSLHIIYKKIGLAFTKTFCTWCPWVRCMMITGSTVSEGLGEGDDIDFDIIVADGRKYSSFLLAITIGAIYSVKYRKQFTTKYFGVLTKGICISCIWEEHQVLPFSRRDGQIAYELLTADVVYNHHFFNRLLIENQWLTGWFPQIYNRNLTQKTTCYQPPARYNTIDRIGEKLARQIIFLLYRIVRFSRIKQGKMLFRMNVVERAKYPYGLFDRPKKQ